MPFALSVSVAVQVLLAGLDAFQLPIGGHAKSFRRALMGFQLRHVHSAPRPQNERSDSWGCIQKQTPSGDDPKGSDYSSKKSRRGQGDFKGFRSRQDFGS